MLIVRNPKYIKMINKLSVFSPSFKDDYDTKFLTMIEKIEKDFLEECIPILMINNSNKAIITIESLFSGISIDNNII